MEQKIKKAIRAIQSADNPVSSVYFFHKYEDSLQRNRVTISQQQTGEVNFLLSKPDTELLTSLTSTFHSLWEAELPAVGIGNYILIRSQGQIPPPKGNAVSLDWDIKYYAVNGGPILCHGSDLGSRFNAIFLRRFTSRCAPDVPPLHYDELKLVI